MQTNPSHLAALILKFAAVYNILWGTAVVLFPSAAFNLFDMQLPIYPQIWQCVGMIVGVYGVGYWIASQDPFRHWPIVLVGLLGKIFGPLGFLYSAMIGSLPWSWGLIIIMNDIIWWYPFGWILYSAAKDNTDSSLGCPHDLEDTLSFFPSQRGNTLSELSQEKPLMLVFLRHFGCSFCREAMSDLSSVRQAIEDQGLSTAIVHMSSARSADKILEHYGLSDLNHFSDESCEIYRSFGLQRGTASQLFGPKMWGRAITAIFRGHFVGRLKGDGFRMPGVFFVYQNEIWGSYFHRSAADRPDYLALTKQIQSTLQNEIAAK